MPRSLSDIWDHFQVIGGTVTRKHVVCVYCTKEYKQSHATRMVQHIIGCNRCPDDIKKKYSKKTAPLPGVASAHCNNSMSSSVNDNSTIFEIIPSTSASEIQTSNESSTEKNDEIDAAIARAIYASGSPLSLLESQYWQHAIHLLSSTYTIPTRHALSNNLLDAEYSRVNAEMNAKISNSSALTLITDGWTNINGQGVMNFIITTPEPIFYKAVYPECERETALYISSEVIKILEEIGPSKTVALVTDNAASMKAAWCLVQDKYPHIACYGCAAHALNLIYKDINCVIPIKYIIDLVTKVIKYVKNKHVILAYFEKTQTCIYGTQKSSLKLPCKTRWNSIVLTLESFVRNKEALKALAISDAINMEIAITTVLLDEQTWFKAQEILDVLKPISNAVTQAESDKTRASNVPNIFLQLAASIEDQITLCTLLSDQEKKIITDSISARRQFCIQDVHFAANLLDPRYMGTGLSSDEISNASNFIHQQAVFLNIDRDKVMANLVEFRTKTGFFGKCYSAWDAADAVSPQLWWQCFASNEILFPIAFRLLSIPSSSAACERNWSLFSNTHTKTRNRLQNERINKLITVRQNLRLIDDVSKDSDDCDLLILQSED